MWEQLQSTQPFQLVVRSCSGVVAHPPLGGQIYIKAPPPPPPPPPSTKKKSFCTYIHPSHFNHEVFILFTAKLPRSFSRAIEGEGGGVLSAPVQPIHWNYNNASGVERKYRVQRPTKVVPPPPRSARGYGGALQAPPSGSGAEPQKPTLFA